MTGKATKTKDMNPAQEAAATTALDLMQCPSCEEYGVPREELRNAGFEDGQLDRACREMEKARLAAIFLNERTRIKEIDFHADPDGRAATVYIKARVPGDMGLFNALNREGVRLIQEIE